jgi:hypothetical protein
MNLWLILPGVTLIVACSVSVFRLGIEDWEPNRDSLFRGVLLVIAFLVGVALLFEGLQPEEFLLH